MQRLLVLSLTLAAACALQPATAQAAATSAASAAAWRSQRMLDALAASNGVPGMGASVVKDGAVVWTGSTGYRDAERRLPVDAHTWFRLASVSKAVAATGAARLVEAGRLDADAPIAPLLPWLDAAWPPISARQLAAHSSGMPHYQAIDEDRGGVRYASVQAAAAPLAKRTLLSPPGTAYSYSSWGYVLLSAVIEAGAGRPFLDYVRTEIAPGLALGPDATHGGGAHASVAYEFADGVARPAPPHDFSYSWAGGGLGATPAALATFGARVMAGEVVSPATLRWMLTPTRLADGSVAGERDYQVAFGWRVATDADGERIAHHAGVAIGARSALVLWPERAIGVSVLSNASWVSSIEQTAMMLAAPFRPSPRGLPPRACPVGAHGYTGTFEGQPVRGTARFAIEQGACVGDLSASGALGAWLNGFEQRDADWLPVIGLDTDGGLSRAALVTPIGLFDLRAQAQDPSHAARLGTRMLRIRFDG